MATPTYYLECGFNSDDADRGGGEHRAEGSVASWVLILIVIMALLAGLTSWTNDSAAAAANNNKKGTLAELLNPGVSKLIDSVFPPKACSKSDYHPSMGLWTFSKESTPVPEGPSRRIYDELLAQIMNNKPACLDVLDSAGIGAVIQHLSKSGALEQSGGDALSALESAHQTVDYVLFPELFEQSGDIILGLKIAERKTGKTVAVAKPIGIPKEFTAAEADDAAKSLDVALDAAATQLLEGDKAITEVTSAGIFFEDSFAQPEASRFLIDQMLAKLVQRGSNEITGKKLRIRAITVEAAEPRAAEPETIVPEQASLLSGAYVISGRYWIRGNAFELVLTLSEPNGAKKMWRGTIKLSEFEGMDLEPKNASALLPPLPPAGYVFEVATTRGANPVFHPGDELNLRIRINRKAWVYCFYVDSTGGITPLFPLPRAIAGDRLNPLKPRRTILIPDPTSDKFRFRFTADTVGEELVSCYSATRDVKGDLPAEMLPEEKPKVVPFLTLDTVRTRFRSILDASVAEALVTMTIAK